MVKVDFEFKNLLNMGYRLKRHHQQRKKRPRRTTSNSRLLQVE